MCKLKLAGSSIASGAPPHTLENAAGDVLHLLDELRESGRMIKPDILIGHSFGGKTVLEMTRQLLEAGEADLVPAECFVLDALPGKMGEKRVLQSEAAHVLSVLQEVPDRFVSKEELIDVLGSHGLSLELAQWMTTNVARKDGLYSWLFDLEVLEELFRSLCQEDNWPFLESGKASDTKITFIRAERNKSWTPDVLQRFEALPTDRVECILLPNSGA